MRGSPEPVTAGSGFESLMAHHNEASDHAIRLRGFLHSTGWIGTSPAHTVSAFTMATVFRTAGHAGAHGPRCSHVAHARGRSVRKFQAPPGSDRLSPAGLGQRCRGRGAGNISALAGRRPRVRAD